MSTIKKSHLKEIFKKYGLSEGIFDIFDRKLEIYPVSGRFDFIISSIAKYCGYSDFKENYKCNFYKPLISSNLIN